MRKALRAFYLTTLKQIIIKVFAMPSYAPSRVAAAQIEQVRAYFENSLLMVFSKANLDLMMNHSKSD